MKKIICTCAIGLAAIFASADDGSTPVVAESHQICVEVVDGAAWTYRTGFPYLETDYGAESPLYPEIEGVAPARGIYGTSDGVNPAIESIPKYASYGSVSDFMLIGYEGRSEDKIIHTVTFDPNGGECDVTVKSVADGCVIGELPVPERDGWTFTGWFTAASGGELVWEDELINSDMPLYAHWTSNSDLAGITYDFYGGVANIKKVSDALAGHIELPSVLEGYRVRTIGYRAFIDCTNITGVTIPRSVSSIGEMAFYGCKALESILIPNSVESIGEDAFAHCDGLENVVIPSSVRSVGDSAFYDCAGLTSAVIESGDIGAYAFVGCDALTNVVIRGSVTSIGNMAFAGLGALESASFSCAATSVMENAFANCPSLKKVSIDMPTIGYGMFRECTNLEEIAFGSSVTSIGYSAFYNCKGLERIDIADLSAWCAIVFNDYPSSARAMYLLDSPEVYVAGEKICNLVIPDGVGEIKPQAFCDLGGIKSVIIPDSVTSISQQAFYNCRALETVTIGRGVTYVDSGAFGYSPSLTLALAPLSLEGRLGETVFSGASSDFYVIYYDGEAPDIGSIEWRTITFDANGGDPDVPSKRVPQGAAIGALPSAMRPGYAFAGWRMGSADGVLATSKTVVGDDMTFYAKWVEAESQPIDAFDSTGGDAEWTVLDDGTWKSGAIDDSQITWMRVFVDAPCTVSFKWKVSSENWDTLGLYVNGTLKSEIGGETDWANVALSLTGESTYDLVWKYIKNYSLSRGEDCGWIRELAISRPPKFTVTFDENHDGGALTTTNVEIATGIGALPEPSRSGYVFAGWYTAQNGGSPVTQDTIIVEDVTYYAHWVATTPIESFDETGGSANWTIESDGSWKSGRISNDRVTWASITVAAPCIVTFQWKTSSEERYDELSYYLDGEWQDALSGLTDWETVTISLDDTASHTITWEYAKDESEYDGKDCGWVNKVGVASLSSPDTEQETKTTPVPVRHDWLAKYPGILTAAGNDYEAAAMMPTSKRDGAGNAMLVWQDFVAGTDPTDENDVFKADITFDGDGNPVISWTPELPDAEAAKRSYKKYGKAKLSDDWSLIDGDESAYNFFKVTVEMK